MFEVILIKTAQMEELGDILHVLGTWPRQNSCMLQATQNLIRGLLKVTVFPQVTVCLSLLPCCLWQRAELSFFSA